MVQKIPKQLTVACPACKKTFQLSKQQPTIKNAKAFFACTDCHSEGYVTKAQIENWIQEYNKKVKSKK